MKITIRLIALVIIGSLMSTGVSAQNIPNADNEYEALMQPILAILYLQGVPLMLHHQ